MIIRELLDAFRVRLDRTRKKRNNDELANGRHDLPLNYSYNGAPTQTGFIVGTGRCGTTILASILNSHSAVLVPPEMQILVSNGIWDGLYEKSISKQWRRFDAQAYIDFIRRYCPYRLEEFFDYARYFEQLEYPQANLSKLLKGFFDKMCNAYGKRVFMEQTPWYGQKLDSLHSLFPDMKVVHIVRDGRDVAISFTKTPWWSKDPVKNIVRWQKEARKIHKYCVAHPESTLEIRYEDLVLDTKESLGNILDLYGLSFEESMLDPDNLIDYIKMFKAADPILHSKGYKNWKKKEEVLFAGSVYAWKQNTDVDITHLTRRVKSTLELFGYEI